MKGCPISIDWDVKHEGNYAIIENIEKVPTANKNDVIIYEFLKSNIEFTIYKDRILLFAEEVKHFFSYTKGKLFASEYDRETYNNFWSEFNSLYFTFKNMT
jgi:hypothetical protein